MKQKRESASRKTKKKRSVFLPVLFGITVAFTLACGALCWVILQDSSNLMSQKAEVILGDYLGMTRADVEASPQVTSGQIVPVWNEEYNNDYAAGFIYKQSPVSGRTVREGQSVTFTVSLGIRYVTIPDVRNYLQADGEQMLKDLGVSVLITQAVEPSVAAGSIIRTDPAAGSQIAAGTTVVVYVSRPQVSTTTQVPSVIGMTLEDGRTLLVQNRLGLGSQTEQYSDQPAGIILSQSPEPGTSAKLNSRVNVVVSAGPEPEPELPSPGDWWSDLWGGSSSSAESGDAGASEGTPQSPADWWASLWS